MRKPLTAAIIGLALALTACGTNNSSAQSALPSGPIVIGVSQALTGDKSDPGTAINQGYAVWAKQVNDAGGLLGHQVQLKVYDNQSLADTAVSQYERLVTVDKVNLLVGPFLKRTDDSHLRRGREVQDGVRRRRGWGAGGVPAQVQIHLLCPAGGRREAGRSLCQLHPLAAG